MSIGAGVGLRLSGWGIWALGLLIFGVVLVVLGIAQGRLLRRDAIHWPREAYLFSEGVELVLQNGEIRAASWADPAFKLDLYARPIGTQAADELLLAWTMDPKIPLVPITTEAFERIRGAVAAHGLQCLEYAADNRRRTLRALEIRPLSPPDSHPATVAEPSRPVL